MTVRNKKKPHQIELHLEISSGCLLNCIHCSSSWVSAESCTSVSVLNSLDSFLSTAPPDCELSICLTGGDPLLCPDLEDVLRRCASCTQVRSLGLFTSGCTTKDSTGLFGISASFALKLAKLGVSFAYISLYSHIATNHDAITQVSGSHATTLFSIKNLVAAGIDVRIHFVPMRINLNDFYKLTALATQLGISEIRLLRLVKHGRATDNWLEIGLDFNSQKRFVQKAIEYVDACKLPIQITVAAFPQMYDCRPFPTGAHCQAGLRLFYIDHDGWVFPCACAKRQPLSALCHIAEGAAVWSTSITAEACRLVCWQDAEL